MLSLPPKKFSSDMAHYQSKIGNCLYLHWYTGTCWSRLPAFRGGWNPLGHPGGLAAGLMQLSILSFMPFPRAYLRLRLAMTRTRTILRASRLSTPLGHSSARPGSRSRFGREPVFFAIPVPVPAVRQPQTGKSAGNSHPVFSRFCDLLRERK